MALDVAVLRKHVQQAMDAARRSAAERRTRADQARQAYDLFLEERAVPVFRTLANILRSEGLSFDVTTPSGGVRLVPERTREDGIELTLDATVDPPRPTVTVVRSRGSRSIRSEQPLKDGATIDTLTEDDVAAALLDALAPWMER
jgi:hypothetical protein